MTQHHTPPRTARARIGTWVLALLTALATTVLLVAMPDAHARTAVPTTLVVLRPVTADGHAANGYRVVVDPRPAVQCWDAAPGAVDAGIATCGSSADYTVACWPAAAAGRVLCLTDPFVRSLRSIALDGPFPHVVAPQHARPQALRLRDGLRFLVRDGGAWSPQTAHPTWVGDYFERAGGRRTVYGPPDSDGVDRSGARWQVTVFGARPGPGVRHGVDRAYVVGTAR